MKPEVKVPKIMKRHLEEIDKYLDKMIESDFSHKGIHEYRESIRRFRALLYFYAPFIRNTDYSDLDAISKRHFSYTSLIREIDVFEEGYGERMLPETIEKLSALKRPLKDELREQAEKMKQVKMANFDVRVRKFSDFEDEGEMECSRQAELFQDFIERSAYDLENVEKSILVRRMMAKKIRYIHQILMPDRKELNPLNDLLDAFQLSAKALHDVCVNLRFIGQFELSDSELLNDLIKDHSRYLEESDVLFEGIRESFKSNPAY